MGSYFEFYAEDDVKKWQIPQKTWDEAILVPFCGESDFLPLIESAQKAAAFSKKHVLLLFVVNSNAATLRDYQKQNDHFLKEFPPFHSSFPLDIAVWDRHSEGQKFPLKQGVGLARKIGADLLSSLWIKGQLRSPYLHSTDADAFLSEDYFCLSSLNKNTSCGLRPFRHLTLGADPITARAIELYDTFLRYHCENLTRVGSPYAYIPLGSNLTFSIASYLEVRGFPKREAGEDFYFLNKMAKVGRIETLSAGMLSLRPRQGIRVPFGTNRSVLKIKEQLLKNEPYLVYHPKLYEKLKIFLGFLAEFTDHRDISVTYREISSESLLLEFCNEFKVFTMLEEAEKQRKTSASLKKHLSDWMDAFRTLKFLHFIEKEYPKVPLTISGE